MKYLPLIVILVLGALFYLNVQRNRQRSDAAQQARRDSIGPGTAVMTTSGLYGTVTAVDAVTDSVTLLIAPNVQVRWAMAALREAEELPAQYRSGIAPVSLHKPDNAGPDSV